MTRQSTPRGSPRTSRRKPARSVGWLVVGICVYAAVAASGVAVASFAHGLRGLFIQLEAAQAEQDELLSEYSRLLLERSTLASYQNVDRVAEERLTMRFPETIERVTP